MAIELHNVIALTAIVVGAAGNRAANTALLDIVRRNRNDDGVINSFAHGCVGTASKENADGTGTVGRCLDK